MSNAHATFQWMVKHLIQDLDGVYAYLNDIVVIASTWQEHMTRLRALFARLREMGLTINLSKSTFTKAQVRYLGHVIGSEEVVPKSANLEAIMDFPTPSTRKEVMRFLGMSSYYRRFCKNFSSVARPLTNLTSPKTNSFGMNPVKTPSNKLKTCYVQNQYFLLLILRNHLFYR